MSIRMLPDGRPGQHLGIGHTLKHYLHPAEVWEDLMDDAPADLRPSTVVARWKAPAPWEHHDDPADEVREDWKTLRSVYRVGYLPHIEDSLERLGRPDERAGSWVWLDNRWRAADVELGLVIYLRGPRDDLRLHTAYRPNQRFPYTRHDRIPRGAAQAELRRKLMAAEARKLMTRWQAVAAWENG